MASLSLTSSASEVFNFCSIKDYTDQVGRLFKAYEGLMAQSQSQAAEKDPTPLVVTGGCLCGSVVYAMRFTAEHPWPPDKHTCQCTQCRKFTGGFVNRFIQTSPDAVLWSQAEDRPPAFTEYTHTPGNYRGFCSHCGSSLTWRSARTPDIIEIFAGSLDEQWLIGDRTETVQSEDLAEKGSWEKHVVSREKRRSDIVKGLTEPEYRFWERNAIVGVTDMAARRAASSNDSRSGATSVHDKGLCVIQDSLLGLLLEGDGATK